MALARCANPVSPEGGPRDVKQPAIVSCQPPNFTTGFNSPTIRIEFDEFISLKDAISEIFISPPLRERLDPRLRGKSLLLRITDSLQPNTTYSITFGNAISDITENNVVTGFSYVFSTGATIDSLSFRGNLINAFDLVPQKDVFIELYANNNDTLPLDSLPLKVPPYYVTKTDENGRFTFHHLKQDRYLLFALADQNGDLIFNQPSEKIAFSDSLVHPVFVAPPIQDTLTGNHGPTPSDSIRKQNPMADSLRKADSAARYDQAFPSHTLRLFEETDSTQRLVNSRFLKEGLIMLNYRYPIKDLNVVPLNFDSAAPWKTDEFSVKKDTISLWITRPGVDTLIAKVIADQQFIDTVRLNLTRKTTGKKSDKQTPLQLTFQSSASGGSFNQYRTRPELITSYPLARWDFSRALLLQDKDTLPARLSFTDSLHRKIVLDHPWQEEKSYTLLIPDSVFHSINGLSQDTIRLTFRTKAERDFGNLIINLDVAPESGQYLIQLLNDKETVLLDQRVTDRPEKIGFRYLAPGKFKLKAIRDRNGNGKWDTGNYKLKIQPEEVFYYSGEIEVRSNWDVEEKWVIR